MGNKFIRLTESDLKKIIKRVISEQGTGYEMNRGYQDNTYLKPPVIPPPPSNTSTANKANEDIKTKKFPCFTTTSVPYDYNPKRGDTAGHYGPAKMDFLRLFQDNSIIVAWENNTIKQYVRNGNSAGKETKKGTWKCKTNNAGVDVVMTDTKPVSQPQKSVAKVVAKSTPNTKESSIGVVYQYEYPNDKKYVYGVKNNIWYGKTLATGNEYDLSVYPSTIANLNKQFPNAMKGTTEPQGAPKPAAPSTDNLAAQQEPKIAPTNTRPQTQVQTAAQSKQSFYNPNDMG